MRTWRTLFSESECKRNGKRDRGPFKTSDDLRLLVTWSTWPNGSGHVKMGLVPFSVAGRHFLSLQALLSWQLPSPAHPSLAHLWGGAHPASEYPECLASILHRPDKQKHLAWPVGKSNGL